MTASAKSSNLSLTEIITTAIQAPGVRVSRNGFLSETFKKESPEVIQTILKLGPVEANCNQEELRKLGQKLVNDRTIFSTGASFIAGMPGGLAMAATIPADLLQFYAVALRLAQELAYLYGEPDLWEGEKLDSEKVTNQLILYCGVMLGASGAAQATRVLSSSLAKQALKKLPQKALTKTFYYPIVKSIAKAFGAKMTKEVFAKGVSKALPVIGGIVSGGITLATMRPMGMRLLNTLDEAHFDYTTEEFEADWQDITEVYEQEESENTISQKSTNDINEQQESSDKNHKSVAIETPTEKVSAEDVLKQIQQAKQMLDIGVISEDEFSQIKAKLISQL